MRTDGVKRTDLTTFPDTLQCTVLIIILKLPTEALDAAVLGLRETINAIRKG